MHTKALPLWAYKQASAHSASCGASVKYTTPLCVGVCAEEGTLLLGRLLPALRSYGEYVRDTGYVCVVMCTNGYSARGSLIPQGTEIEGPLENLLSSFVSYLLIMYTILKPARCELPQDLSTNCSFCPVSFPGHVHPSFLASLFLQMQVLNNFDDHINLCKLLPTLSSLDISCLCFIFLYNIYHLT